MPLGYVRRLLLIQQRGQQVAEFDLILMRQYGQGDTVLHSVQLDGVIVGQPRYLCR